jgi:hypothetical protein
MGERGIPSSAGNILRLMQHQLKGSTAYAGTETLKKSLQLFRCRAMGSARFDLDAHYALRLVSAQFPEIRAERAEPFGVGWDNAAFLIDGKVLFRFPRSRNSAELIEREIGVLPLIAAQLPVAVSAP